MKEIEFLTSSQYKFNQVKAIIPQLEQTTIEIEEIQSLDQQEVTYYKLFSGAKVFQDSRSIIVEDTGVYFKGLNNFPGPLIKWMCVSMSIHEIAELVMNTGNTQAFVKTTIGYLPDCTSIEAYYFTNTLYGTIVKPRGDFRMTTGCMPIFVPDGHTHTLAEMDEEELYSCSMRIAAAKELKLFLDNQGK